MFPLDNFKCVYLFTCDVSRTIKNICVKFKASTELITAPNSGYELVETCIQHTGESFLHRPIE